MEPGKNCRNGYNPEKGKHCKKCTIPEHHEFECPFFELFNSKSCNLCKVLYHITEECPNYKTYPPRTIPVERKTVELFCITSNLPQARGVGAGKNNPPSLASSSGKVIAADSLAVTSLAHEEVPESLIKDLTRDWMDQTKQSNCSEPTKERDLKNIQALAESFVLARNQSRDPNLGWLQALDSHLRSIRDTIQGSWSIADKLLPKFFMEERVLYKKYCLKDPMTESHVVCLPDALLPAVIHLLHVKQGHPSFTAARRHFELSYTNRNATRMIKSYVKACATCNKVCNNGSAQLVAGPVLRRGLGPAPAKKLGPVPNRTWARSVGGRTSPKKQD
jgi:hypothetical protein